MKVSNPTNNHSSHKIRLIIFYGTFLCLTLLSCGHDRTPTFPTSSVPSNIGSNSFSNLSEEAQNLILQYDAFPYNYLPVKSENSVLIANSNHSNLGFLCEAPDGTIYYTKGDGVLYHSNPDGSNQKKIMEVSANNLQFQGNTLYFWDMIYCTPYYYKLDTGETGAVLNHTTGDFIVNESILYYASYGGFFAYDLETKTDTLLADTRDCLPIWMTKSDDIITFTLVNESQSLLSDTLLFAYSLKEKKLYYLGSNMWMPLLAENKVIYQDQNDAVLKSLDLDNGQIKEFSFHTCNPSINNNTMYYIESDLMKFDFASGSSSLCLPLDFSREDIFYIYQSKGYVYVFTTEAIYCYNKSSGKVNYL